MQAVSTKGMHGKIHRWVGPALLCRKGVCFDFVTMLGLPFREDGLSGVVERIGRTK